MHGQLFPLFMDALQLEGLLRNRGKKVLILQVGAAG